MPHNLHVVLVHPEIPFNTGSIGRTCLATQSGLHLIEPLGFKTDNAHLKRAGLDYWQHLRVTQHKNWEAFVESLPHGAPKVFFSTKAKRTHFEHQFAPGTYLVFGCETKGLPEHILKDYAAQTCRVPQYDARVRSLNLANAVGIVLYEAIRQLGYQER